jgi:hypothetical protein
MTEQSLFRLAAVSGFVSAAAIIVGKVLMLLPGPQPGEIADFVSPLFGLGAIVGVYLWQRNEAGTFGAVAFVVVFIGLGLVTSLDFFGAFIRLELSEQLRDDLLEGSPGIAMAVSGIIFLAGVIMFGVSLIRSGVYPVRAGWFFMVGFVFVPLVEVVGETVVVVASVVAGVGVFWLSWVVWSEAGDLRVADAGASLSVPVGGGRLPDATTQPSKSSSDPEM